MYTPLVFCVPLVILYLMVPGISILLLIGILVGVVIHRHRNKHMTRKRFVKDTFIGLMEMDQDLQNLTSILNEKPLFPENKTNEINYHIQQIQFKIRELKQCINIGDTCNNIEPEPYDPKDKYDWRNDKPFGEPGEPPLGI